MTRACSFETIDQAVEQVRHTSDPFAREMWQLAEISFQEVKSAQLLKNILQKEGFMLTSTGTAGVPTAFIVEWGAGAPLWQ